jgi:dihydropteroate synthase
MGVLNVTPDSFSDGGLHFSEQSAVDAAFQMVEDGADLIDIGGESTRPGSSAVPADEQIRRIVPVLRKLRDLPTVISVDTTLSEVALAAMDAGASVINDISAGRDDEEIFALAARRQCPIVLMHMLGRPKTMQASPHYQDVVGEVMGFLEQQLVTAGIRGVATENILLDPGIGIGFGKTTSHNLELLRHLRHLTTLGRPLVVGTSRKRFIGEILDKPDPNDRLMGTAATVAWAIANGAGIVRVHDVEPIGQVVKMIRAIMHGEDRQTTI